MKVQWTEQLVATQQQKTEQIKKETEQLKVTFHLHIPSYLRLILRHPFVDSKLESYNIEALSQHE